MPKISKKSPKKAPIGEAKKPAAPRKPGSCADDVWVSTFVVVCEIADSMKGAARKDVLAACIKVGLNKATANAQYQRWLHRAEK